MVNKCLGPNCGSILFETQAVSDKGMRAIVAPAPKLHEKDGKRYFLCGKCGGANVVSESQTEGDGIKVRISHFIPKADF